MTDAQVPIGDWQTHDGGPNPVPGRAVDLRCGIGVVERQPSDRVNWSFKWRWRPSSLDAHAAATLARLEPQGDDAGLTPCDYCGTWRSKPCGEGCYWSLMPAYSLKPRAALTPDSAKDSAGQS